MSVTQSVSIHPTAVVASGAKLGVGVKIGPYSIIESGVEVGDRCVIEHHAHLKGPLTLGPDNHIHSFASIGCDPQDKKFHQEETYLHIGARNSIREYVTISRGTEHGGWKTVIGDDNLIMAYVHIAHDCILGSSNTLANNATLGGHVQLGDFVGLGGFTAIHQFVRVGSYAFTGGGSIVTKDIPPYMLISGHPAKMVGLNLEGLKRRGFTESQRMQLKEIYRQLFRTSLNLLEDAEKMAKEFQDPVLLELINFILGSSRGITR